MDLGKLALDGVTGIVGAISGGPLGVIMYALGFATPIAILVLLGFAVSDNPNPIRRFWFGN